MKNEQNVIPIFFTIDDGYAPYLSTALDSMIQNASPNHRYIAFIVTQGVRQENYERLIALGKPHFEVRFVAMKNLPIANRPENLLRCNHFTQTIYFRLFLADMFPEYDKGIYLDSDIIVPGDISELYATELDDQHVIAACPDYSIQDIPALTRYVEKAVGVERDRYINSGVLVLNMKIMREIHFGTQFLMLMDQWHFDTVAPDQDYLNAMCYGRVQFLDECWDAMPKSSGIELEQPKLIHYNLFRKPWFYDDVSYEDYFWKYAEVSSFYPEIIQRKESYGEQARRSDQEGMDHLLEKAAAIPDAEINFRKAYERGASIRI